MCVYSAVESIRRDGSDEEESSAVGQLECARVYGPAPIIIVGKLTSCSGSSQEMI